MYYVLSVITMYEDVLMMWSFCFLFAILDGEVNIFMAVATHIMHICTLFFWYLDDVFCIAVHSSIPRRSDGSVVLLHLSTFPVANLQMTANDENFKVGQMNTASDMAADMHVECQVTSPDI